MEPRSSCLHDTYLNPSSKHGLCLDCCVAFSVGRTKRSETCDSSIRTSISSCWATQHWKGNRPWQHSHGYQVPRWQFSSSSKCETLKPDESTQSLPSSPPLFWPWEDMQGRVHGFSLLQMGSWPRALRLFTYIPVWCCLHVSCLLEWLCT